MKLSVIVPVYNVENYIHKCIDSILNQTFQDFELILVDDGSPDGCPVICDQYAQQDERIRVIHKPNGGISGARNAGLDAAQGEYISFVDSDDYISPDMYSVLVQRAEETYADIATIGYIEVTSSGETIKMCSLSQVDCCIDRKEYIDHFFPDVRWKIMPSVCNKIFKSELFKDYRFPTGYIYEDSFSQLPLLDQCQKIAICSGYGYFYLAKRADSIMNAVFSHKNLDLIELGQAQYDFFLHNGNREQQEYALEEYTSKYIKTALAVGVIRPDLQPSFNLRRRKFLKMLHLVFANPRTCRLKKVVVLLTLVNIRFAYILTKKYFPECLHLEMREKGESRYVGT